MMPILHCPGVLMPGQFGPMSRDWKPSEIDAFKEKHGYAPTVVPVASTPAAAASRSTSAQVVSPSVTLTTSAEHGLVAGNTVVVIEHTLDVIKTADWVIDMGPQGGVGGGQVVATGTPEQVAGNPDSVTGRYLRRLLSLD
jgi:hypothetical protein